MRTLLFVCSVIATAYASQALAMGGMGDSSALLKQQNAICDAQRRGEGPRYPDMCQKEYPPAPEPTYQGRHG